MGVTIAGVWQKIWRLKVPPNIRNFVWRCMHEVLPTMSALRYRGVDLDVVTPLWNGITLSTGVTMTFANWLESVISAGPMAMVFRCVATCWGIWRGRNDQIWNNKPWQLSRVRAEIDHLVDSWTQSLSSLVAVAEQPFIVGSELSGGVDVPIARGWSGKLGPLFRVQPPHLGSLRIGPRVLKSRTWVLGPCIQVQQPGSGGLIQISRSRCCDSEFLSITGIRHPDVAAEPEIPVRSSPSRGSDRTILFED
nr:uncharacterized protein LOC109176397 [Ipomoea batatas]